MLKFVFDNILKHSNMLDKHGLSFAERQGFKRLINKLFVQISVEILWTADYIRIFAPQTRVVSPKMKYFACASNDFMDRQ